MMEAADLTEGLRNLLRNEAIITATTLANISCNDMQSHQSPYQKFYDKEPLLKLGHLAEFGRLGYVTERRKIKSKLAPKAIKYLLVGYAFNHTAHTYRLYNPKPRHIILSRDVRWDNWNTKDPKQALREHRQVYMQHLVNKNSNGWSDHQTQQFNNLIDHYIQPQHTPLPETMPPYLDYADYDLVSADGSHLSDFQPPNEEDKPPPPLDAPHQQNLEEAIQWLAEEQQEQELEGHEDTESEAEEEEEINIIEDSDDEYIFKTLNGAVKTETKYYRSMHIPQGQEQQGSFDFSYVRV
jgi:hypothetical protein